MASKINGITIAIGADTSGVTEGLKDITAASVAASKNLKDIDKLLQLDPGNVELAAERQKVLQDAIDATAKKMQTLEAAQGDVKRAFEAGQIDDAQYIAFQRELVNTAKRMQDLEKAAQSTDAAQKPLTETVKAQEKQLAELRQRYIDTAAASGRESDEAKALAGKISELSGELAENRSKLDAAAKAADELTGSQDDAGEQAKTLTQTVKDQERRLEELKTQYIDTAAASGKESDEAKALARQISDLSGDLRANRTKLDEASDAADGFDKSLEEVDDSAKQAGDGLSVAAIAAGQFIGGLALDAVKAAADGLKDLAAQVVTSYGDLEQSLGGSEAVFGKYASDIQREGEDAYKNLGISQAEYLAAANKMGALFQGAGFEQQQSLDMTSKAMQRAADVASVMGIDTSAALEAIAGAAKGNFTMMDNLGVAINDTTLQAYAQAKGMEKLETTQDKVTAAMALFLEQTEQYDGNFAREASETVAGSFGLLQASWDSLIAGLGNGAADIENLTGNLTDALDAVAKNVVPVVQTAIAALPSVVSAGMQSLRGMLPQLGGIAMELGRTLWSGLSDVGDLIGDIGASLTKALPTILPTVTGLVGRLSSQLAANSGRIVSGAVALVKSLGDGILASVPVLLSYLPGIITNLATGLIDGAGELATAGVDLLTAVIDDLPDIIDQILTAIPQIITGLQNAFLQNGPKIMQSGITLLTRLTEALPQIIAQILRAIPSIIGSIVQNVIDHWPDIVSAGYDLFTQLTKDGPAIIRHIVNMPGEIVDNLLGSFRARFADMWQIGRDLFDRVRDGITGLISDAWTWGTDLIDGFIGGIRDKIGQLADIAADCAQVVRDFLGFSEPDKGPLSNFHTFAPDMMKLFAQGIKQNEHLIADAFDASLEGIGVTAAISGTAPAASRPAASGSSLTIAPTINVASVSSDYDVRRISDRMIEYISEGLSTLEARQAALQGG